MLHALLDEPEATRQQDGEGYERPKKGSRRETHSHCIACSTTRSVSSGMMNSTFSTPLSVTRTVFRKNPAALCQATMVYVPGRRPESTKRPDASAFVLHRFGVTTIAADIFGRR